MLLYFGALSVILSFFWFCFFYIWNSVKLWSDFSFPQNNPRGMLNWIKLLFKKKAWYHVVIIVNPCVEVYWVTPCSCLVSFCSVLFCLFQWCISTPLVEIQSQTMTAPYFTDRNVDTCCTSLVICSSPDPALLTSLSSFPRLLLLLLLLHTTHYAEIWQFFWLIAIWELSYFMHLKWCYFFFVFLFFTFFSYKNGYVFCYRLLVIRC